MRDSDFTKLIVKASKMAVEHRNLVAAIDEESQRRHGYYPAELDCDEIIDIVQYGGGGMTASDFDEFMRDAIKFNTDHTGKVRTN
jgi:hypothetical protein